MKLNTIFFIGPQGSGKGTQAKLLAQKLGFFYWEMGAILRQTAAAPTPLGKKVKNLIDSGILLKDQDLYEVVKAHLNELPKDKGVIFDGIPRRLGQAEFILDFLKKQGRVDFATLYVSLSKDESVKRLLNRAKLENRADDTLEKIEFRLKQYQEETVPVLDFLNKSTAFFEVDGAPKVEEVAKKINQALGLQ